jgi:hypothetical protein
MAVSERKKASNKKWDVANIERLSIAVPKGERDEIRASAAAAGESINKYIIAAIRARMGDADGGASPAAEIVQAAQPVAEAQPGQVLNGAALESAKVAAAAAGETLPAFVARAVQQAADADARERLLAVACKNASLPSSADASAAAESCATSACDVVDWAARTDHLRALRESARASAGIPSPEQTAPGNSGDLPPEQAGSKTPGD